MIVQYKAERMNKMEYKHPKKYVGMSENLHMQHRIRQKVEAMCLKCEKFMGKEHDFSECLSLPTLAHLYMGEKCPKNLMELHKYRNSWVENKLKYDVE